MDPSEISLYKDFRSPSQGALQHLNLHHKYYSYRSVHPSMVGQYVYYIPGMNTNTFPPRTNDMLLTHPDKVRVRTWTKRDQFDARETDLWPLDRRTHKLGRRKRRGCDYVPPRWSEERSEKGRQRGRRLAVEGVGDHRFWSEMDEMEWKWMNEMVGKGVDVWERLAVEEEDDVDGVVPYSELSGEVESEYDMIEDLYDCSESDWEVLDAS